MKLADLSPDDLSDFASEVECHYRVLFLLENKLSLTHQLLQNKLAGNSQPAEELAAFETPHVSGASQLYSIDSFTSAKRSSSNLSEHLSSLSLGSIPEGDCIPSAQPKKAVQGRKGSGKKLRRSDSSISAIVEAVNQVGQQAYPSTQLGDLTQSVLQEEDSDGTSESSSQSGNSSALLMFGDDDSDMSSVPRSQFHVTQYTVQAGLKDPNFPLMLKHMRANTGEFGKFKEGRDLLDFQFLDRVCSLFRATVTETVVVDGVNIDRKVAVLDEDGESKLANMPEWLERKKVIYYYAFARNWDVAIQAENSWNMFKVGLPDLPSVKAAPHVPGAFRASAPPPRRKRNRNKRTNFKNRNSKGKGQSKAK